MGLFDKFFGKNESDSNENLINHDELIEAGACPNCWGRMSYDGKFKDFVVDQTKSNINHDNSNRKTFINQFVETHVTGIKLKSQDEKLHCPKCNQNFKK